MYESLVATAIAPSWRSLRKAEISRGKLFEKTEGSGSVP